VLERLEEKVGSRDASPRADTGRRPDSEGGPRPMHQSKPQGGGSSRPKSAAATGSRSAKKPSGGDAPAQATSESALNTQLVQDPTALDLIDPVLMSFDDRRTNPNQPQPVQTPAPIEPVRNMDRLPNTQADAGQGINYSLLEMSEEAEIPGGGRMQVVGDSAAGWVPEGALPMGCRVEVRHEAGRICGNVGGENGTYDIDMDNGTRESGVSRHLITVVGEPAEVIAPNAIFKVGDKVEGNYRGSGSWYSATVKAVNQDCTYTIEYDDGDMERNVLEINLGAISSGQKTESKSQAAAPSSKFEVKESVLARYRGNTKWYPGQIKRVHGDGTFDVLYDDGEEEHHVGQDLIEKAPAPAAVEEPVVASAPAAPAVSMEFRAGDKVEGRFRGRAKWYPAKVVRVREEGQYDIDYDDGEEERRVPAEFVRRRPSPDSTPVRDDLYAVGDKVMGNFAGDGEFFAAVVRAKQVSEGQVLYDLLYDDGDSENGVEAGFIKPQPRGDSGRAVTSAPALSEPAAAPADPPKHIVPEDDLNDFLAGLSDDEEGEVDGDMIGGGLDAGGSQYEGGEEYGEDFDE
jgi:hypothetical protein